MASEMAWKSKRSRKQGMFCYCGNSSLPMELSIAT